MRRRDFLKGAGAVGAGSIALAVAPSLLAVLPTPAHAAGQTGFRFHAISTGGTVEGVVHSIVMGGDGIITPDRAVGGGSFVHFDNASGTPRTIIGTGTWKAGKVLDLDLIGSWGAFSAGTVEMEVTLVPIGGAPVEAVLFMICNIGFAGLSTGLTEGYILTIPGAPFSPFQPLTPNVGLTIFTNENEQRGRNP